MRRALRIARASRARFQWFVVAFGEIVAQAVEPALPVRAPGDPPTGIGQRVEDAIDLAAGTILKPGSDQEER
jgi:hypothetical protein